MAHAKTAAPCEVCGQRVSHHGSNQAEVVGYTAKGVPRLIHVRCHDLWVQQRSAIMARWPELKPAVWPTLLPRIRHRIERCLNQNGGPVSRGPRRERFAFPPGVTERIRTVLKTAERRKGQIKKLYEVLQREHPDWMPPSSNPTGYTDFYQLWTQTEKHLRWEREQNPPPTAAPATTAPPAVEAPIAPVISLDNELAVMVRTAHALIDLAAARQRRDAVEFVLEGLAELLKPPSK